MDLFELAGDEHRSYAYELQVAPKDLGARKVAVDEIHSEVQRLVSEPELAVHVHQPIYQRCAHVLRYV